MTHLIQTKAVVQSEVILDTTAGKASLSFLKTSAGINLSIMQSDFADPVKMRYEPPFEPMGMGFCLCGNTEDNVDGFKHMSVMKPGETVLNWSNCLSGLTQTIGSGKTMTVGLFLNHDQLSALADRYEQKLPKLLQKPPDVFTQRKDAITPSMRETIQHIVQCPFHGLTRDLFLEGKVLELMTYKLEQLDTDRYQRAGDQLKQADLDRVRYAAELLIKEPENAPCLDQLARTVGMSRTKFHDSFLKVYGVTPFDYLQSHRLRIARFYMLEGKMNVTEAAFAVGYSSSNYFSRAFKKFFGVSPKQYCKTHLKSVPDDNA